MCQSEVREKKNGRQKLSLNVDMNDCDKNKNAHIAAIHKSVVGWVEERGREWQASRRNVLCCVVERMRNWEWFQFYFCHHRLRHLIYFDCVDKSLDQRAFPFVRLEMNILLLMVVLLFFISLFSALGNSELKHKEYKRYLNEPSDDDDGDDNVDDSVLLPTNAHSTSPQEAFSRISSALLFGKGGASERALANS